MSYSTLVNFFDELFYPFKLFKILIILMSCLFATVFLLHSMPLTLEWSASPPHDIILAGCHDGVVIFGSSGFTFFCALYDLFYFLITSKHRSCNHFY